MAVCEVVCDGQRGDLGGVGGVNGGAGDGMHQDLRVDEKVCVGEEGN